MNIDGNLHGCWFNLTVNHVSKWGQLNGWATYCNKYNTANISAQDYEVRGTVINRKKGDKKYGEVTSKKSDEYPSNNYSGNYWYIRVDSK